MDAPARTRDHASRLRRALTYTEAKLWTRLRRGALGGLRFRRQHPIGRFILDFYCDRARLAVEVDGGIHQLPELQLRDALRDAWLAEQKIRVVRIPSQWVIEAPERVDAIILAAAAGAVGRPKIRTLSAQHRRS